MAAVCKQPYPAHCGPVRQVEETQSQWRKQETLIQSLMEEKNIFQFKIYLHATLKQFFEIKGTKLAPE